MSKSGIDRLKSDIVALPKFCQMFLKAYIASITAVVSSCPKSVIPQVNGDWAAFFMLFNDCLENNCKFNGSPQNTEELTDFFAKSVGDYKIILNVIGEKHRNGELQSFLDGIVSDMIDDNNKTVN